MTDVIKIIGAREHNLKNINVEIPRDRFVVFTGVSGSGKSSLVFNTIFAEAQRQFLESLGSYARMHLPKFTRPNVDEIRGMSPAIMIDQKRLGRHPRSTVGTATEIYTYLRLLFSRCGEPNIGDSNLFSFNTPEGACPVCKGLGEELTLNEDALIDWDKSLEEGAIKHSEYRVGGRRWSILQYSGLFDMKKPLKMFGKTELNKLLYSDRIEISGKGAKLFVQRVGFEGIVTSIKRRRLDKRGLLATGRDIKYFTLTPCKACGGSRLNKLASSVKVNGRNIAELVSMELTELRAFIRTVKGTLAHPIVQKIDELLSHLIDIGVGYLPLNQSVASLSGGESQRVKIARQLGVDLIGLTYIFDEPSAGLHPRDISHLISILKKLKDGGNSVLVVEHDPAIIESADYVVDLGPGAGRNGGRIVFEGTVDDLKKSDSVTGKYLLKDVTKTKANRRKPTDFIPIKNANVHNLKNMSVDIPKAVFTCITGVAGSGKSTLINEVFVREHPDAIVVDQSPVGRSVRSNPATYVGVFGLIRKKFAEATGRPEGLFSFNSKGACPKCGGLGFIRIDMHFLESVDVTCDLCDGKRYIPEVLKLKHNGKNVSEVLDMTVSEAREFFEDKEIKRRLNILEDIGLGYLELGQPLDNLSGGEAQRIKLASELHKKGNIYVMDEPTTGLHMADVERLVNVIDALVAAGNTVIVIEHNLDVIKNADWIIDLGPEGGIKGGKIIAEGTPEEVAKVKASHTGQYLGKVLY
jgi:excinuclease UvrABC ATPase subunit